MTCVRGILAITLSIFLSLNLLPIPAAKGATTPSGNTPAATTPSMGAGTVVAAERARVGTAAASVGSTVFSGDKLDTDAQGSVQVRSGAARFLLSGSSAVSWGTEGETPTATLSAGTAVFSTANVKAFAMRVGKAVIRPEGNEPTIGNVTVLNAKELIVRCPKGAVTVTVEDDTRVIPEGMAYRIVLDPDPATLAAAGAWGQGGPVKAGRSRFVWYAIAFAALVTALTIHYALESPDRP
ncbi:MAG TPA: hypothetical protein VGI16_05635 [Candidatus Acidoferrum sp.]|jgi:ferric-dicitrate binding protein FerR (iron transport regulator)